MKPHLTRFAIAISVLATSVLTACTQMPTEKQSISDVRPQIAFKFDAERLGIAKVIVDGLDVGTANEFRAGIAALRVLPGSHSLRVMIGTDILLEERFYIGDGVSRTFILK